MKNEKFNPPEQSVAGLFAVSASPHIRENRSVRKIMWNVVIALMPALIAAVYFFGIRAFTLTLYSVIAAVLTEAVIQKLRKKEITVLDGSAVITGILVAFNLHSGAPWWIPVVGSVFAISIGKHVFGGIGNNPLNPALLGRVFLVASWPTLTTAGWKTNTLGSISGIISNLDIPAVTKLVSTATPLAVLRELRYPAVLAGLDKSTLQSFAGEIVSLGSIQNLFLGNIGGCIGEVSAIALLIGAFWLAIKNVIEWRIPVSYVVTVFILTYIFGGTDGIFSASIMLPIFHIFSGGLILGAFFMATDMVTSPLTKAGRIYFGIGCGLLTTVIRLVGGYPEGVSYSILLMNLVVPLIDKFTIPKAFGGGKR